MPFSKEKVLYLGPDQLFDNGSLFFFEFLDTDSDQISLVTPFDPQMIKV